MQRFTRRGALLALAAGTGGCVLAPPPTLPTMDLMRIAAPCRADTLVVMLPGAYSRPQEFVDEGYLRALHAERGLAADVVIADAHFGYYTERSILRHLRDDIVGPARAQGYARVWLVGISLGGFGALGWLARGHEGVDGVLAIAPYLGRRLLLQEISNAGGPARWRASAPAPRPEDDDLEREIWWWLTGGDTSRLYLGHGVDDRFADAQRVAASLLGERGFSGAGGHDWDAWRLLWSRWLDRGLLAGRCTA